MIRAIIDRFGIWNIVAVFVALGFAVLMWFWWYATHTVFREYFADTVTIAGDPYDVTHWQGVDAAGSPLNMRACFVIDGEIQAPPALDPKPEPGPGWFRCFNPDFIASELADGKGMAYVAQSEEFPGVDRIIAVLSGGRAFMWRQSNGRLGGS